MINLEVAFNLHKQLIEEFGGGTGIRDMNGLESALARPYSSFNQQDLYAIPFDKAAAVLESVIINHPFVDGNKRTAYGLMQLILLDYGLYVTVAEQQQYAMVIAASIGEIRFDEIKVWSEANATALR